MSNKEQDQCLYCHQKLVLYDDETYFEHENQIELARGGWTGMFIGINAQGDVIMRACGDDYTDDYHPKYCPKCGRRLK